MIERVAGMESAFGPEPRRRRTLRGVSAAFAWCAALTWVQAAFAQAAIVPPPPRTVAAKVTDEGPRWNQLTPRQREALSPLHAEWPSISASQREKWLELSARFPAMQPIDQTRIQERMTEWARLTPQARGQARLNFQEAKQLPAQDRKARWNAYQALSPERRRELATRGAPLVDRRAADAVARPGIGRSGTQDPDGELPTAKSNIVANPRFTARPRAVTPTVIQGGPGATTTPITRRPAPPPHQQTGLPKIAATPGFVDKATLQPQRGPQGAATREVDEPVRKPSAR
ncbi:MAG: DUF3106 domain-containing protein [Burkholderiaceae bacterium]